MPPYVSVTGANCVLHQNYITGMVTLGNYAQFTNNIKASDDRINYASYSTASNCIIKNNTLAGGDFGAIYNSTIENNICYSENIYTNTNSTFVDNYVVTDENVKNLYSKCTLDTDIKNVDEAINSGKYGAFAGDDPYVTSGVPAAPVIEDITVPVSVEQGNKLNVTVKLGLSR